MKVSKRLEDFRPDLVIMETKAPIMDKLWKLSDRWKKVNPDWKIVFVGDHVSFFPEESLRKSAVDFVLTGGDYDFQTKSLVEYLEKCKKLAPGIFYKKNGKIVNSGKLCLDNNLDETPVIDRKLTCWQDYGEAYLYHPCAYIMTGRGCGIDAKRNGACTFCIWEHALWGCRARLRSPEHVLKEVKNLYDLGVKEIFDDNESGPLANVAWLTKFYRLLKEERLLGKVVFSSNARGDQLVSGVCKLLKKIGYRLLKVGLESGSEETLKLINKRENLSTIIDGVKTAKDSGLKVMLTVMTGYPWEKTEDVEETYRITKELMFYKTGAGDCLQASVVTPYPGSPLWLTARSKGWFKVSPSDYEKFDMDKPVLKSQYNEVYWCRKIWSIQSSPEFILKSALSVGGTDDVELLLRGAVSLFGHKKDFNNEKTSQ